MIKKVGEERARTEKSGRPWVELLKGKLYHFDLGREDLPLQVQDRAGRPVRRARAGYKRIEAALAKMGVGFADGKQTVPAFRPGMSFKFETAAAEDLARLVEPARILFESEAEFSPTRKSSASRCTRSCPIRPKGKIYVAREGREVVGMPAAHQHRRGCKAALFEILAVAPEHRQRGIAAMLLKHVIEQARAEGVLRDAAEPHTK